MIETLTPEKREREIQRAAEMGEKLARLETAISPILAEWTDSPLFGLAGRLHAVETSTSTGDPVTAIGIMLSALKAFCDSGQTAVKMTPEERQTYANRLVT